MILYTQFEVGCVSLATYKLVPEVNGIELYFDPKPNATIYESLPYYGVRLGCTCFLPRISPETANPTCHFWQAGFAIRLDDSAY